MRRALVLTACLSVFLAFGVPRLDEPGLQYDEVLFVNAAIGADRDTFVSLRAPVLDVPVMVMPYIGALKSWLWAPVFAIGGVSPWTVRLPSLLIVAATIAVTYAWSARLFGAATAIVTAVLMACDPAQLMHARIDWGPTSLMGLFKALLLLGTMQWLHDGARRGLWLAVVAAALGLFDKLNFVWTVVAIAGAAITCYGATLRRQARTHRGASRAAAVAFGLVALAFGAYTRTYLPMGEQWVGLAEIPDRLLVVRSLLGFITRGDDVFFVVYRQMLPAAEQHATIVFGGLAVGVIGGLMRGGMGNRLRGLAFLGVAQVLLFVQIVVTRQATGPHHAMMMSPLGLVTIAALLSAPFDDPGNVPSRRLARAVMATTILAIAGTGLLVDRQYVDAIRTALPPAPAWDARSQRELVAFAAGRPDAQFVNVDWGTHTGLLALSQGRTRTLDRWPVFRGELTPAQIAYWANQIRSRPTLFVVHAAGREVFPETRVHLLALAAESGWRMELAAALPGTDGQPLIEIMRLVPPDA